MRQLSRDLGYGPWLLLENVRVPLITRKGVPTKFRHTSALCQAGPVQIELAMPHDDEPSVFKDIYPMGTPGGFHHTAMFVEDFPARSAPTSGAGFPCVQLYELPGGKSSCFIDTRPANGHMLELLEES
jgi:hypothetical protein